MADEAPLPSGAEQAVGTVAPSRLHLVVVTARELRPEEGGVEGAVLRTRFWHPGQHRWSENDFESLEHALRLFIDESGWVLRQQQALDAPLAHELIFEARRIDFTRPSREQILRDIGMSPEAVDKMLEEVDRRQRGDD
ncbi:MAG TPA: hypothetical protein VFT84_10340 [Gemmatimonadales bacterium]|nr:hypothetical protein [Gemmatimonadales bacterium]